MSHADNVEQSRQIPLGIIHDVGDGLIAIYNSCGTRFALREEVQLAAKHHFGITIHGQPDVSASIDNILNVPNNIEGWKMMANGFSSQIDRWCQSQLDDLSQAYPNDPAQLQQHAAHILKLQQQAQSMAIKIGPQRT